MCQELSRSSTYLLRAVKVDTSLATPYLHRVTVGTGTRVRMLCIYQSLLAGEEKGACWGMNVNALDPTERKRERCGGHGDEGGGGHGCFGLGKRKCYCSFSRLRNPNINQSRARARRGGGDTHSRMFDSGKIALSFHCKNEVCENNPQWVLVTCCVALTEGGRRLVGSANSCARGGNKRAPDGWGVCWWGVMVGSNVFGPCAYL